MRAAPFIRFSSLALFAIAAGCSGGGGGDKADVDVIVGLPSGPVTETGEQATFTVRLRSKPGRDVVIPVSSVDVDEGTASPATLTFTRENWDAPQTVLVTGVDDTEKDGNTAFQIALGPAESTDKGYAGFDADDVLVTNLDDETAGVRVSEINGQTTELGTQVTFTVVLQSRPTADVLLIFGTSDLSEGTSDLQTITFTPDNWNTPVTVTVTGVDDANADGAVNYQILFQSAFSEDPDYAFLPVASVPVTNLDDDSAGILVNKTSGTTSELQHEQTFSVQLLSRPSATVQLTWLLSDTGEASFTSTTTTTITQTFTTNDWNVPKTFTIRGDNDTIADGDQPYNVSVSTISSQDTTYATLTKPVINLVNVDDDIPGFIVTAPTGPTRETTGTATFQVSLRTAAAGGASVSVNVGTTLPKEATVNPSTMNLTTTPQTVTVTGVIDFKRDGHKPFGVTFSPAVSTDAAYDGRQIPNVGLTNIDDGPVRTILVYDDAYGSQADEAADEAGYTVVQANDTAAFDSLFDAGADIVIFESTTAGLPAATEARLVSWATGGGSLILSHWDLASHPALESALEVSATPFSSNNRLFLPSASAQTNLFAVPNVFPAPLIGDVLAGDQANELVLTTAGEIAVRFDDGSVGPGAVAITRQGAVIVNGFSADDLPLVDNESDGVPDLRELYMNEIVRVSAGAVTPPAFSSDFEANSGGLIVSGNAGWEWGAPTPHGAFSGTNAWDTVLAGDYGNSVLGCLTINDLLIPSGAHWQMRVRYELESGFDFMTIEHCDSTGASCTVLLNTSATNLNYEAFDFDLSAVGGQVRDLRWCLQTDTSVVRDGISIDDVVVTSPAQ